MGDEWRPRAWRLPDGGTLVEGPAFPLSPTGPDPRGLDGESLTEERTYYRLGPEGRLEESYEPMDWSLDDELGVQLYHVEGNVLLRHHAALNCWSGGSTHSTETEQVGLVPLPPKQTPSSRQVRALAAENRKRRQARGQRTRHPFWPYGK
ncbi:hypothetical protein [Thermomonospora amylolytica]|uniref:hypothetical protein n=1 Tax=Thermomonospora amylolytica TaxID=1411117 RepID=UPI000E6CAF92|nr:hypothetical protein [Thermomonospora amylolytica]